MSAGLMKSIFVIKTWIKAGINVRRERSNGITARIAAGTISSARKNVDQQENQEKDEEEDEEKE